MKLSDMKQKLSCDYDTKNNKRGTCSSCNEAHEYKERDFEAGFDSALSLKCEDCKYYVGDWHDCDKDVMLGCDPTFFCKYWEGK